VDKEHLQEYKFKKFVYSTDGGKVKYFNLAIKPYKISVEGLQTKLWKVNSFHVVAHHR
jgi:hypothetical protein